MVYDFVGVGGLAYDLALHVNRLPIADEKYPATLVGKLPGGFIANATCAAARLGQRAGYVGWIGEDAEGAMLRDDFVRWGVEPVGLVQVSGQPTPFTLVLTDDSGARGIVLPSFPLYTLPLTANQLDIARQARVVYTFPHDTAWCRQLATSAAEGQGLLALDVESAGPLSGEELRAVLRLAGVVFLTSNSLAALGVQSPHDLAVKGQWIIKTAGRQGAYGFQYGQEKPVFQPALPVEAVDTTGAGDCFHAALLVARLDGAELVEALRFAGAAAAIKVQHRGARGGLPTRDEVKTLLRQAR